MEKIIEGDTMCVSVQPSQKTLRTKRKLAKKAKQNRYVIIDVDVCSNCCCRCREFEDVELDGVAGGGRWGCWWWEMGLLVSGDGGMFGWGR